MRIEISPQNMKLLGRTFFRDGLTYLSYSGSSVEFEFTGKKLGAWIVSEYVFSEEECWIGLLVDGILEKRICLKEGKHYYSLMEENKIQKRRICLMKLTEVQYASCALEALETEEGALCIPVSEKRERIVFLGDSITCGFGVEGDAEAPFSTKDENVLLSYGMLCAEKLFMEPELVCFSGIGLVSRYVEPEEEEPRQDVLIEHLYQVSDWYLTRRKGWERDERWKFEEHPARIVVINLGTNDVSWTRRKPEREKYFQERYICFLQTVRESHQEAKLICVLGAIDDSLCSAMERAVNQYRAQTGDREVFALRQEKQGADEKTGSQGHPNKERHEKMAEQLTAFIKELG